MRIHVCVLTPSSGFVRAAYVYSLYKMMTYCMQTAPPVDAVVTIDYAISEGSGISSNRAKLVNRAVAAGATHILFVDDDMGFAPNAFYKLLEKRRSIIGCTYPTRKPGGPFTALALDGEDWITPGNEKTGIVPAAFIPFGFTLVECTVFETLEKPWFTIDYDHDKEEYSTEDVYFCKKAAERGIISYVDYDASQLVFHVGSKNYTWMERVSELAAMSEEQRRKLEEL